MLGNDPSEKIHFSAADDNMCGEICLDQHTLHSQDHLHHNHTIQGSVNSLRYLNETSPVLNFDEK